MRISPPFSHYIYSVPPPLSPSPISPKPYTLISKSSKMQYGTATTESWYMATSIHAIDPLEIVERLASENAVVVFSASTCCMCHAVKRLFCGMGVHPTVYELDQEPLGREIERALARVLGVVPPVVPVVFIGGKMIGAMDRVMASHINGTLVPLLKEAGALWL